MSPRSFTLGLALVVAGAVSANGQGTNARIRFQAMDRNNDGVITRDEWRGSAQSFTVHDWNGDGRLSGNEIRIGAARDDRAWDNDNFDYEREYVFDDWTERRKRIWSL